jgi:hypothetical protein
MNRELLHLPDLAYDGGAITEPFVVRWNEMPVVALQARRAFSWLWIKSDDKAERLGRLRGFTVLPTGRT